MVRTMGKIGGKRFEGEWRRARLGNIATITMGSTPPRADPVYWGGGHTWLSVGDLHGKVMRRSKETITEAAVARMQVVPAGTLLMSFKLSLGKVGFAGTDLYTNEAICHFRQVAAESESKYMYYALQRVDLQAYGRQAVKGYTLNSESLGIIELPLPPLPEQRAIAAVLTDVDDLIGSLEALIAKKQAVKKATMQELLTGRTRLPGFGGKWTTGTLGGIATITMGRTPPRADPAYWGGRHVWLSVGDLGSKVVDRSKETITDAALVVGRMQAVPAGTLMMSFKLSLGKVAFAGTDLYTNEAICHFRNVAAYSEYLYYGLQRVDLRDYGRQAVKGYTLNSESLANICLPLPPLPEQRAIAAILTDMDAEIAALERRLDKTCAIKQGMMQQLLTGSIRLPIPTDGAGGDDDGT